MRVPQRRDAHGVPPGRVPTRLATVTVMTTATTATTAITVITGGAGFLGRGLAAQLRADGSAVVTVDRVPLPAGTAIGDVGWRHVVGDLADDGVLDAALTGATTVVHLASVVSADAEADPERAWSVNIDSLRAVLAACAERVPRIRFVFASSVAVFDDPGAGGVVGDETKQRPRSVYGVTKAIGELLVNDATRRGIVDGRTARLPTVIVRPGRPNLAASSFASGMFREPLAGVATVVPVPLDTGVVVIGHRSAIAGLTRLCELDGDLLGEDRAIGMPGLEVTVGAMVAALEAAGVRHGIALGALDVRPDPAISAIVGSWPTTWDDRRARALGFVADRSLDEIIDAHLADAGQG